MAEALKAVGVQVCTSNETHHEEKKGCLKALHMLDMHIL